MVGGEGGYESTPLHQRTYPQNYFASGDYLIDSRCFNYREVSIMETIQAFMMGQANRGNEMKVFDWDKAVELIKKHRLTEAYAGLSSDLEWTGGCILKDQKPVFDSYTFLASTWATPVLYYCDEDDVEIEMECYTMASQTKYGSDTKWPVSALAAIKAWNRRL